MISRRHFIQHTLGLLASGMTWPAMVSCSTSAAITGGIVGQNHTLGHRLRDLHFDTPARIEHHDVVIVGGGVAGLSAARALHQAGTPYLVLEMHTDTGGNALAGHHAVSAYPWGAHYLPLPHPSNTDLLIFLQEAGVITGYENGLPVYHEYYLCFDPKERLYINHYWQDGLLPHEGVPARDRAELERFTALMHAYKIKKGNDGKDAFTIPIANSSQDPALLALDHISMAAFLQQHQFTSPYLTWYVNYCCADDYGATMADVSAWAAIHYFASRKGVAANAGADTVLTWPEGNYWLVKQLRQHVQANIRTQVLAYQVDDQGSSPWVDVYDVVQQSTVRYMAKKIILATPQFITTRLLKRPPAEASAYQYAPWMVANLTTTSRMNERHGEGLCWDNVVYGQSALGYVHAGHQHTAAYQADKRVLTFYQPLTGSDTQTQRRLAHQRSYDDWKAMVFGSLQAPHPELAQYTEHLDVWIWGHGMIRPSPDFIWHRTQTPAPSQRLFFAHSDLSGISIFEEAFYQGLQAARSCIAS